MAFSPAYPGLTIPGTVVPSYDGGVTPDANYSYTLKLISKVDGQTYFIPSTGTINMGFEYCDVGALEFTYALGGVNADKIVEDSIVVGFCDGAEMIDARWHLQAAEGDPHGDEPYLSWVGKSMLSPLEKVLVLGAGGEGLDKTVDFNNQTIGYVLNYLFNAAQARSAMTGYTWNFTNTLDSAGVSWGGIITRAYPIGSTYADVLRALNQQGLIEFRFTGTQVNVYRNMTMGVDRSATVELVAGRDYEDTPYRRSVEDRATFALIGGDEGAVTTSSASPALYGPFGREEVALTQSGTTDTALLGLVGAQHIDANARVRAEYTREVTARADGPRHARDYRVGDKIGDRVGSGRDVFTVRSIVLRVDQDATTSASIVLNDKFYDREVLNAIALNNLFGGVSVGGIPSDPLPVAPTPNVPTGLNVSSLGYVDVDGRSRSVATIDWNPPTQFTTGATITDAITYETQWRYTGETSWRTIVTATDYALLSNLDPTRTIQTQVRAVVAAKPSAYTGVVSSGSLNGDTTAPGQPSAPTTSSARGIINVSYDWTMQAGGTLPNDTAVVELHRSQTSAFTPNSGTFYAGFFQAGTITVSGLAQNTNPWFFRLVAVDRSGNRSVVSNQASQVVNRIEGPDLLVNSITGNELKFGSIETDHLALGVLRSNLIADGSFEDEYTIGPIDIFGSSGPVVVGNLFQWRRDGNPYNVNGVVSRSELNRSRSGNRALTLTVNAAADEVSVVSNAILLRAGSTYRLSFSAASVGVQGNVSVQMFKGVTAEGINYFAGQHTITGTGDWTTVSPPLVAGPDVNSSEFAQYDAEITVAPGETALWTYVRLLNYQPAVGGTIVIDDVSLVEEGVGGAAELTSAGLRLFESDGKESAAMVSNRPNVFSVIDDGDTLAALTDSGGVLGRTVSSEGDMSIMGLPMLGKTGGYAYDFWNGYDSSRDLDVEPVGVIEALGKGQIAEAWYDGSDFPGTIASGGRMLMFFMFCDTVPGRQYSLRTSPWLVNLAGAGHAELKVYRTVNGTNPTEANGVMARCYAQRSTAGYVTLQVGNRQFAGAPTQIDQRFLFTITVTGTTGTIYSGDPIGAQVDDIGYMTNRTGTLVAQNLASGAGAPAAPSTKKTYTSTWAATSSQTRRGTSSYGTNTVNTSAPSGYTLAGYYSGSNGNQFTLLGFTSANSTGSQTGISIGTALSGATIKKVELYVKNADFYYNSGGQQRFGISNLGSIPGGGTQAPPTAAYSGNWSFSTGQGRWVALPSSAYAFLTGGGRVAIIGPGSSNSQTYYSKWNNHSQSSGKPALRITYEK